MLEKNNNNFVCKIKLDLWEVLLNVRAFIKEQSGDLKNKENKLLILDEYFRLDKYSNNEKVWTSGHSVNYTDMDNFSLLTEQKIRLKRPNRTKPCGETFYINEDEIFVD